MIRSILFAGAAMLAIPAIAQTTEAGSPGATSTSDVSTTVGTPAQGSMNTAATGSDTGTSTPTGQMSTGTSSNMGTTSTTNPGWTGQSATTGMMDAQGNTTTSTSMAPQGSMSSSPSQSGYTGVGGPVESAAGRDYPACSRTVTDSCSQVRRSGRPR